MGKRIVRITTLLVMAIGLLMVSCSKEDETFFSKKDYYMGCFIDSSKVYTLEDVIGKQLDTSCCITNQYGNVLDVQVDKNTGKHQLILKDLGFTKIKISRNEENVTISVQVITEAFDNWVVERREESIDCSPTLKNEILKDMFQSLVLPKMSEDDRFSYAYGKNGKWRIECKLASDPIKFLDFDYDKTQKKYYLYDEKEPSKKQCFTFSLIRKNNDGRYTHKSATFTTDLTDFYQKKYGVDKVEKVKVVYHATNHVIYM